MDRREIRQSLLAIPCERSMRPAQGVGQLQAVGSMAMAFSKSASAASLCPASLARFPAPEVGVGVLREDIDRLGELRGGALKFAGTQQAHALPILADGAVGSRGDVGVDGPRAGAERQGDRGPADQAALGTIEAAARRQGRRRLDGLPHPLKQTIGAFRKDYISAKAARRACPARKSATTKRTQEPAETKGASIS